MYQDALIIPLWELSVVSDELEKISREVKRQR